MGGLAAMSLDALSSVAYGPKRSCWFWSPRVRPPCLDPADLDGDHVLLLVLVVSYRQVIAVTRRWRSVCGREKRFGPGVSLLAAASLVVDYVLTVAVSLSAGAASLGSVFPVYRITCWRDA